VFVVTVSALVSRKCIETNGLFNEAYFLYSEDCEYSLEAINNGFIVTAAPNSIFYRKDGKSSGTLYKDYYGISNNLCFNKQHLKKYIITAYLYVGLRILKKLAKLQIKSFNIAIKAVFDYYQGKMGRQL
jgi:GT2 family glycosyltransferase